MSRDPRATARACFALAARAGTDGEKQAALNRGMALLEKYKLDPNDFAIPGRARTARPGPIPPRPFLKSAMSAADREAILDAIWGEAWRTMQAGGFSFDVSPAPKPETATQKAEREREERMSAFVEGRRAAYRRGDGLP